MLMTRLVSSQLRYNLLYNTFSYYKSVIAVQTCYSCFVGLNGSRHPFSVLIMLGHLGTHHFNSLQGTLKALSTSKQTGTDVFAISLSLT